MRTMALLLLLLVILNFTDAQLIEEEIVQCPDKVKVLFNDTDSKKLFDGIRLVESNVKLTEIR